MLIHARQHGFSNIETIDDDLGRSASGTVARPGFDRLVALLCAGQVGAVLCFDASRLARNGRDWHHLLELCGLVEACVIDHDGVYNPCRPNDRLLLGMKGSISEFELGVLRARMLDAARSKARRGELRLLRIMREDNLLCLRARPFVPTTTNSRHGWQVVPKRGAVSAIFLVSVWGCTPKVA